MTAFELAERMVGEIQEMPGGQQHPYIVWCHYLCGLGTTSPDEVPWCSSFVNEIAWRLRLPRSKSAAARSWLGIGQVVNLKDAKVGYDVVILKRGTGAQPGIEVIQAPGHVGFYAGQAVGSIHLLGGNQGNGISIAHFPSVRLLGIRRLKEIA